MECRYRPSLQPMLAVWWAFLALCFVDGKANADVVEDFHDARTLRGVIGYAGGGYDISGRVLAEQLGRYLPGKPLVVAENMPGAGSFLAAKYLHDVAPSEGTTFGCVPQTLPLATERLPAAGIAAEWAVAHQI